MGSYHMVNGFLLSNPLTDFSATVLDARCVLCRAFCILILNFLDDHLFKAIACGTYFKMTVTSLPYKYNLAYVECYRSNFAYLL